MPTALTSITLALLLLLIPTKTQGQEILSRKGVPTWDLPTYMPNDVFTFVRIKYNSQHNQQRWKIDYPDSDLNISYRLQQLTSLKVSPNPKVLTLTDPELFHHPFIYLIEPGKIYLSPQEQQNLRKYLLNGGFLMIDDFWGEVQWQALARCLRQVFPKRKPTELPLSHPIFNCVFTLDKKPQIPAIKTALDGRSTGRTWELKRESNYQRLYPNYYGLFDDQGRLMCIICHNTDLGDGWEREGENHWYFKNFSEKYAYPLGINIVFYALTH